MARSFLSTLDDPRLEPYRALTTKNLTRQSGLFIAEGRSLVERLIDSEFEIESILMSDHREEEMQPVLRADLEVLVIPRLLVESLVGFAFHSGVMACGRRKPSPGLEQLFLAESAPWTVLACPYIEDSENLGQIIRTAAAFGATALLLDRRCADPFSRRVLRVSMGNAFRLPIVECGNLDHDLLRLRTEWNFRLMAAVLSEDAIHLEDASRGSALAILLGNEATGLDQRWLDLCDRQVTIPMSGKVDSLNVAASAAVLLYHFGRNDAFDREGADV